MRREESMDYKLGDDCSGPLDHVGKKDFPWDLKYDIQHCDCKGCTDNSDTEQSK